MSGRVTEVKEFCFKQLRKVEFGDPGVPSGDRVSLLACSSLYSLTFVATRTGVAVFDTAALAEVDKIASGPQSSHLDVSSLSPREVATPFPPLHLSLSCDSLTLCIVWRDNDRISLNFFDTRAVVPATSPSSLRPFSSIVPNTTQGVRLCGLQWNPSSADLLAVSLSSGGLYILGVKEDVKVVSSQTNIGANSLCWSPKGKQVALGLKDGCIAQYNHRTGTLKRHACPNAFNGEPQQVTDLHWVSTFSFAAVFTPAAASGSGSPTSLFISTPKDGPMSWTNFEDVYYGGSDRSDHFYFTHLAQWGLMMTSSANAMETVVFSQFSGGGGDWEQWELEDTGRAEVPLKEGDETHIAGMALSLCSTCDVSIDDNLTIAPCPLLLLYSTAGVLCPFWLVHRGKSGEVLAAVVSPPTPLPAGPPLVAAHPSQPQPQSVGTHFTAGAILAASSAPHNIPPSTQPLPPQLPASTAPFLQTPTTGSARPPPPPSMAPFLQTPTTGSVRPQLPASMAPFVQTPTTGSARPPPPPSMASFGQTPTTGSVWPQLPASTAPFVQTPTTGSARPPPPPSMAPFGQTPTTGSVWPQLPASMAPFVQTPTTGSVRPPPPASTAPFVQTPTTGSVRPQLPASTAPFVQTPTTGSVRPPPPASMAPFVQTPPTGSVRPQLPASTAPFGQTPTTGSVRPPPPASTAPFGQTPTTGSARPQLPASTAPFRPPDPSRMTSLGVTARSHQPHVRPAAPHSSPPPPPPSSSTVPASVPQPKEDSRELETAFSAHIRDEIDNFVMELEDFKESVESVLGEGWEEGEGGGGEVVGLGTVRHAVEVMEEEEEVARDVLQALNCVKELGETCDQLRDEVLRGLELSEKARVGVRRRSDREHALRQKVRPLDTTKAKKLNDIRELFLRVDQKTGEVNGQLDTEMQKRRVDSLVRGRLKPPSIQTVYASLRDHNKIIKLQEERAVGVVREMKRLRFIPMTWSPEQSTLPPPPRPPVAHQQQVTELEGGGGGRERHSRPDKLDKLREYLMNIEKTPLRRVPRALPSATPSVLSAQMSGRSSPGSSIPHYLVSGGSKPRLYEKTSSSLAHVPGLTPQDSTTCLDTQPRPYSPIPPHSPPPPPSIPAPSIPPPPPPVTSGHTISWGAPPSTEGGVANSGVGVANSGLRRAEGQLNLSSISQPSTTSSGVVLPFSFSLLSSTSQPPPSSRAVFSGEPPVPPTTAPSLLKPSLSLSSQTPFSLSSTTKPGGTDFSLSSTTKPEGTGFSLSSTMMPQGTVFFSGQPSTKPGGTDFSLSSTTKPGGTGFSLSSTTKPEGTGFSLSSTMMPQGTVFFSGQPSTKPGGTLFSLSSTTKPEGTSGPPGTRPPPTLLSFHSCPVTTVSGGKPVSSPFVFGATLQNSIFTQSQTGGEASLHPTPSSSQPNQSVGGSKAPNPVFSLSKTSPGRTTATPAGSFGAQSTTTSDAVVTTTFASTSFPSLTSFKLSTVEPFKPPASTAEPFKPPASTAEPFKPPASTVEPFKPPASTAEPFKPPASTAEPFKPPASTAEPFNPPASTAEPFKPPASTAEPFKPPASTAEPFKPHASTVEPFNPHASTAEPFNPPASTAEPFKPPASTAEASKPPIPSTVVSSATLHTRSTLLTPPLAAGDVNSGPQPPTTARIASTTPTPSATPPSPTAVPSPQQTAATGGGDEMEDDMDQADVVSHSLPPVSSVGGGGGGLFGGGGLGSLGLGGTPRSSATANPFDSGGGSSTRVNSTLFSGAGGLKPSTTGSSPGGGLSSTTGPSTGGGLSSTTGPSTGGGLSSTTGPSTGGGLSSTTGSSPGGLGAPGKSPFSQPSFGQGPKFGQSSVFGGSGGASPGGGFNFGGFASAAARMEDLSFGSLANQEGSGSFSGQPGSGSSFTPSSMSGSSFSGWRQ